MLSAARDQDRSTKTDRAHRYYFTKEKKVIFLFKF